MNERMARKAVVPVAGIGSRLLPLTKAQPKEMLPLGRKPVLQYVVEELAAADIRQILLITGRRKRSVEDHFDEDGDLSDFPDDKVPTAERLGVILSYLRQPRPLGSGHAVWLAKTFTDDEPFFVAYGDCVIWERQPGSLIRAMVETFHRYRPAAVISVQSIPRSQVSKYGVVALGRWRDGVAEVTDIVEKPSPENAPSRYAVAARYLFAPIIYDALAATRPTEGEWQLTDAIRYLLRKGEKVFCVELGERQRLDVGNFADYFTAFLFVALHDPEVGATIRRQVRRWLTARRG
ncbi:MAG: hypothetical protein SLRJCFUN_000895 [Candidatus Fervidibacter sp.]